MMKLLVLVALALSFQFLHAAQESFILTGDIVDSYAIDVSDNYKGTVDFVFNALDTEDVTVCINWLVPAEAPSDVDNLTATWNQACTYSHVFPAGTGAHPVTLPLRSSLNWVSASLVSDVYSDGVGESFNFVWEYSFTNCPDSTTGPDCLAWIDVEYGVEVQVNGVALLRLPTYAYQSSDVFLRALQFDSDDDATVSYRLNAPIIINSDTDFVYDGFCADVSDCEIPIPPFSSVTGFNWNIQVTGNANFTIVADPCPKLKMGVKCSESYYLFNNKAGDPLDFKGERSFVFTGTDLYVAVAGVDGYEQDDVAPPILVQVDQLPTQTIRLSSGINSKANRLGFTLDGITNNLTRYVVTVLADSDVSYGIWIPQNATSNQCPLSCSGHGDCDDYICRCEDDYDGLGCEHEIKEFTIEYIILIAVGGLLVLSIVIGVPIYCWMNRQQDYETIE